MSLPARDDVLDAVAALDRGQDFRSLSGWRHRQRVAVIVRGGELARLLAWYAR